MYDKYDDIKNVPEKTTRIRISRSRVADGECLQRRGVVDDVADDGAADGMVAAGMRWWCMLCFYDVVVALLVGF